MNNPIRILLAEDHPVVRKGMSDILDECPDLQMVGEVDHGRDIEPAVQELQPDVLLLDLRMPELDPASLTRRLKERYPALQVLVLTAHDDAEFVISLLSAGAVGYVLKDEATDTLVEAIRAAALGKHWFSSRVTQQLVRKLKEPHAANRPAGRDGLESLTQRELEILRLIGLGMDNQEIAGRLYISRRTVEGHVSSIYTKLKLEGRAQAVLYAVDQGLIADPEAPAQIRESDERG